MVSTRVQKRSSGGGLRAARSPSWSTVLVDSSRRWLEAVEGIVRSFGMEVVGKATTSEAALSLVEEQQPDLLVSEIGLEGESDGIALVRAAQSRAPHLGVVVLASSGDLHDIEEALAAGARVYVVKTDDPDDLASAMQQALELSTNGGSRRKERASA